MSSEIKVSSLKAKDGTAGISISDSTGNVSLSGTLSAGTIGSSVTGFGLITGADQWRYNTSLTTPSSQTVISTDSNWERNDTNFDKIGTGMGGPTSGVFTFPATGIWFIQAINIMRANTSDTLFSLALIIELDPGTGSFSNIATGTGSSPAQYFHSNQVCSAIVDVTNSSTFKVRFSLNAPSTTGQMSGDTSENVNSFTFIRLGDT